MKISRHLNKEFPHSVSEVLWDMEGGLWEYSLLDQEA